MNKSKSYTRSSKKIHACCDYTYCSLAKWYTAEFEKLGWIVLAKSKGKEYKVKHYLETLDHLIEAIEHKLTHIKDSDKKDDLHIMLNNSRILKEHAQKDFA